MPADGVSCGQTPPASYGFFVGADGVDMAGRGVPVALAQILPAADTPLPGYPADPDAGDGFADARLAFPN